LGTEPAVAEGSSVLFSTYFLKKVGEWFLFPNREKPTLPTPTPLVFQPLQTYATPEEVPLLKEKLEEWKNTWLIQLMERWGQLEPQLSNLTLPLATQWMGLIQSLYYPTGTTVTEANEKETFKSLNQPKQFEAAHRFYLEKVEQHRRQVADGKNTENSRNTFAREIANVDDLLPFAGLIRLAVGTPYGTLFDLLVGELLSRQKKEQLLILLRGAYDKVGIFTHAGTVWVPSEKSWKGILSMVGREMIESIQDDLIRQNRGNTVGHFYRTCGGNHRFSDVEVKSSYLRKKVCPRLNRHGYGDCFPNPKIAQLVFNGWKLPILEAEEL
jgi:hypothetical protein